MKTTGQLAREVPGHDRPSLTPRALRGLELAIIGKAIDLLSDVGCPVGFPRFRLRQLGVGFPGPNLFAEPVDPGGGRSYGG